VTAFEPVSNGNLVEGLEFHKFYFDNREYYSQLHTAFCSFRDDKWDTSDVIQPHLLSAPFSKARADRLTLDPVFQFLSLCFCSRVEKSGSNSGPAVPVLKFYINYFW
jgi:hypothetical protein